MKKLSLKKQLILFMCIIVIPLFLLNVFSLYRMKIHSDRYNRIISNIEQANQLNISFKSTIDREMYYIIIGMKEYEDVDIYDTIQNAKNNVAQLKANTDVKSNITLIEMVEQNIGILERHINKVRDNLEETGHYDENMEIWEDDIQSLTSLIDDYIQEYVFYEISDMESVRIGMKDSVDKTMKACLVALVLIIGFASAITILISENISKPIRALCMTTNQVAKGDFNARVKDSASNEIQELTFSMNKMIRKIGNLVNDIKLEQLKLRNTELKLLQAQINPHFLYNTLDAIIWLAEAEEKENVVRMVTNLSDFFRTSLSKGRDWVTLREEETHIRSYLQIQQFRYRDILDYEIDIPSELSDYCILKLTLQPIVENALYHGVKNKRGKGKITVRGQYEEGNIMLSVSDNGIGLSEDTLNRIRFNMSKQTEDDVGMGFGLVNVNERIKLNYGTEFGIQIDSILGEGTTVTVLLPADIEAVP